MSKHSRRFPRSWRLSSATVVSATRQNVIPYTHTNAIYSDERGSMVVIVLGTTVNGLTRSEIQSNMLDEYIQHANPDNGIHYLEVPNR